MKKRKRTVRHYDEPEQEDDTMVDDDTDVETKEAPDEPIMAPMSAPQVGGPLNATMAMRDVGMAGMAAIRGTLTPKSGYAAGINYHIASLPPKAALIGGGIWVGTAFDTGGTLNISLDNGDGTYALIGSADLSTVGFNAINLAVPKAAPDQASPRRVIGALAGGGGGNVGCADVILMYA